MFQTLRERADESNNERRCDRILVTSLSWPEQIKNSSVVFERCFMAFVIMFAGRHFPYVVIHARAIYLSGEVIFKGCWGASMTRIVPHLAVTVKFFKTCLGKYEGKPKRP